jgi:threonine synthase
MFGSDIPDNVLEHVISKSLTFPIPLRQLDDDLFVLELFHGPTLAFKDVGARFMSALFEFFLQNEDHDTIIIVATSGDTGSAVANAFFSSKGIKVIILYPSGKVSTIQEKQMTTMGGNITALEVDGDFDDCQRLVKQAFSDEQLNIHLNLTSANSINFARLFPQTFYYFHALARLKGEERPVAISVPSGNFGNLTAGLIAKKMGLGVHDFIAVNNANHPVVDYLVKGGFNPGPTRHTITNAMDVGNPSNFRRILELFNNNHDEISAALKGYWFTDEQTLRAIKDLDSKYGYQADPHGAIAYLGLQKFMEDHECQGIFLETAHPAKFQYEPVTHKKDEKMIPETLKDLLFLEKRSIKIPASFDYLKNFLMDHCR